MPDPATGEPTAADVAVYSQGRLAADSRTALMLEGALAHARDYCGWHVIPVLTEAVVLDGPIPASPLLVIRTGRLVGITDMTEDGAPLDVSTLDWSEGGRVYKPTYGYWTPRARSITATIQHGFETARAFNLAVISAVDRIAGNDGETVGPFKFPSQPALAGSAFSGVERALLDRYLLGPRP